jgi:M6 family metalloprotease-like protein
MVHEIGHDIGWPDLYDTWPEGGGDSYGVGAWSVMGNGSWNYTGANPLGSSPSLPDAFSRVYQGWVSPTVVSGSLPVSIDAAATTPEVFQLLPNPDGVDWSFYGESGVGEYFLVCRGAAC